MLRFPSPIPTHPSYLHHTPCTSLYRAQIYVSTFLSSHTPIRILAVLKKKCSAVLWSNSSTIPKYWTFKHNGIVKPMSLIHTDRSLSPSSQAVFWLSHPHRALICSPMVDWKKLACMLISCDHPTSTKHLFSRMMRPQEFLFYGKLSISKEDWSRCTRFRENERLERHLFPFFGHLLLQ